MSPSSCGKAALATERSHSAAAPAARSKRRRRLATVQRRMRGQRRLRLRRGAAGDAGLVDEDESDIGQIQDTLATRTRCTGFVRLTFGLFDP
jgi:hypothetical protein